MGHKTAGHGPNGCVNSFPSHGTLRSRTSISRHCSSRDVTDEKAVSYPKRLPPIFQAMVSKGQPSKVILHIGDSL